MVFRGVLPPVTWSAQTVLCERDAFGQRALGRHVTRSMGPLGQP